MKINLQFQTNNHEGRDDTPVMRSTCADYKISKNTKKINKKIQNTIIAVVFDKKLYFSDLNLINQLITTQ
jgi:hypothetical protein